MILCHRYKFIFLKTNKTAGTSIEIALSKFCEDRDVITPITADDELLRTELQYRGPQNYLVPLSKYGRQDLLRLVLNRKRKRFYNHIAALRVKDYVGDAIWNDYYKFCFERNPWDRVVSQYFWRHPVAPRPTLSEFIRSDALNLLKRRGIDVYTMSGKIAVDRVCMFEELTAELEGVRNLLGIPVPLNLPRAKSSSRQDRRHYRELFTDEDRERVGQKFAEEISLFGYEF
jgi:hypothetical protein